MIQIQYDMENGRMKMVNRKKMGKTGCLFLAAAMTASQIAVVSPVYAADQEYAGTTQISSSDVYPAVDTSAVELEIEEVYAEEGSRLAEGDAILKLTEESYQAACAYYEAAIIKADSTLTDTQLAYDQGVLEAKYTWESAEADAENAEYIRTYQTNEVENALMDHEEALEDIGDRITELEEGIADGSYDTSSSASSGSSASGSGNKMSGAVDQQESEKESEFERETESENQSESESESETESENQSESEISQAETEPASGENENSQPETELASGETADSNPDNGGAEDSEKTAEELHKELAMKMAEAEKQAQSLTEELKSLLEKTDTEEPDDTSYSVYTEQLKNIISQLESDIKGQEQVKDVLEAYDFTEKDSSCEVLTETIEGDQRVLDSLKEIQEKMTKYQTLISSVMSMWESDERTVLVDTETLTQMSEYLSSQAEINELSISLLEQYESEIKELEEKVSNSAQDSSSETESEKKTDVTPENADKTGSTDATGSMDQSGKPDTTGNTDQSENPDTAGNANGAGNIQSADQNGSAMSETGASGGSARSMSGAGAVSGTEQGSTVSAQETTMSGQNGQSGLSDEEISLLGDTYDLSEVEQLLSREPSDSDDAQDLIDELEDSRETTQEQYEELQRKQKIFELEIQHTYDTAVIAGKLAELTYQQSLEEWEETLAEARQDKADLEAQKALLETMTDGAIYADQAGAVAAIFYEAGDSLSSDTSVVSYYDTDTVSIILEVDQEDIAGLSVGDTAEVTLTGAGQLEGTITEKSIEPESGTSRTSVKYTVTVSIDNTDGRLSDGMSATVTFPEDTKTDTESEETEANTEAAEQETETDEEAVVNE